MVDFKLMAAQLRKPQGDFGKEVALQMNVSNDVLTLSSIAALNLSAGDKVLEIGMGNGLFCKDILQVENTRYTGCDFSELMVSEASGINRDFIAAGKANFVLANAADMPFADASFDKVFTINTIYFWDEPAKILSEIKRVLHENGILAIGLRTEESMKVLPFIQYGFTVYDKPKIQRLLEENGFEIIDIIVEMDKKIERENDTVQMENMIAVCTHKKNTA